MAETQAESNPSEEISVDTTCATTQVDTSSTNTRATNDNRKMNKCQRNAIYGVGGVVLALGFLITGFWWYLYNSIVLKQLPLYGPESQTFQLWSDNPVPLQFSIYMFNWTNAEATLMNNEKPKVKQVGPYVYKLNVHRENFVWNDNSTLTYLTWQRYYFAPELSKGDPYTDVITSPNVILITISQRMKPVTKYVKVMINTVLKKCGIKPYVVKTVDELLFTGYDDKLLDLLQPFKKFIPSLQTLPDRFAWYLPKNQTIADIFNIHTGVADLNKMGLLQARNFTTELPAFEGSCAVVGGSPGDFWPGDVTEKKNASLFISDFCSTFQLGKTTEQVVGGIEGIRYVGDEVTFDNGSLHSEKSCYCPNQKCEWKSGVRDVSSCVQAPVFLSFPHFYGADKSYLSKVRGLRPNKSQHTFYMTLQKDYGVVLNGAARLQLNMHLEPIEDFGMFANVPDVLLPTLWFDESINLPPTILDKLHFSFTTVPLIFTIVGLFLVILGSIGVLTGLILSRRAVQEIPYVNEEL